MNFLTFTMNFLADTDVERNLLRLLRLVESLGLDLGFWLLDPALQNRCFKSQQEVSTSTPIQTL